MKGGPLSPLEASVLRRSAANALGGRPEQRLVVASSSKSRQEQPTLPSDMLSELTANEVRHVAELSHLFLFSYQ